MLPSSELSNERVRRLPTFVLATKPAMNEMTISTSTARTVAAPMPFHSPSWSRFKPLEIGRAIFAANRSAWSRMMRTRTTGTRKSAPPAIVVFKKRFMVLPPAAGLARTGAISDFARCEPHDARFWPTRAAENVTRPRGGRPMVRADDLTRGGRDLSVQTAIRLRVSPIVHERETDAASGERRRVPLISDRPGAPLRLQSGLFFHLELHLGDAAVDHAERFGGGMRDIDHAPGNERPAVVDPDGDGLPGCDVGDAQARPERQRTVCGGQFSGVELLAARGPRFIFVEARDPGRAIRHRRRFGDVFPRRYGHAPVVRDRCLALRRRLRRGLLRADAQRCRSLGRVLDAARKRRP